MLDSVRTRLTLWYVAGLALVLIPVSVSAYVLLARSLYDRLDARLVSTLQTARVIGASEDLRFPNQTLGVLDSGGRVVTQKTSRGGPPLRLPAPPLDPADSPRFYELVESQPDADDSVRGVFQRLPGLPGLPGLPAVFPTNRVHHSTSQASVLHAHQDLSSPKRSAL